MEIKLKEVLIFILLVFLSSVAIIYYNRSSKNSNKVENKKYAILVSNSTEYYKVVGMTEKFVQNSNKNSLSNLLSLIDEDYKSEKKINSKNVFKFVTDLSDARYTFSNATIYYKKISSRLKKYYVKGSIIKQSFSEDEENIEYYVVVNVDSKNNTFSIIPDNGNLFKEATK